jgi:hypothetical protein
MNPSQFDSIWSRFAVEGDFALPKRDLGPCKYAREFRLFVDRLFDAVRTQQTLEVIITSKAHLLDGYIAYYNLLPRRHCSPSGRTRHQCLHAVLQDAQERLHLAQIALGPVQLAAPSPPAIAQISGIYLGDEVVDPVSDQQP